MTVRRGLAFAAIVAAVVAIDQATKAAVRASMDVYEQIPVIDGVLWLTHIENTGAAFGMLRGRQWFLIATAVAMLAVVAYVVLTVRLESGWARTALALVSGGAIGNLIDRVGAGAVTDFFDLGWFPVFNVADIALDVGVAILAGFLLFGRRPLLASDPAAGSDAAVSDPSREVPGTDAGTPDA